jgi:hypothetical protein
MLLLILALPRGLPADDSTLESAASVKFEVVPARAEGVKQLAAVPVIPELVIRQSK